MWNKIGRADELGSGVRNLFIYVPIYSGGGDPQLIEQDVFKIIIPVPEVEESVEKNVKKKIEVKDNNLENRAVESRSSVKKNEKKNIEEVINLIRKKPNITIQEIVELTGLSKRAVEWRLKKLREQGKLKRIGPDKGGYWQVID